MDERKSGGTVWRRPKRKAGKRESENLNKTRPHRQPPNKRMDRAFSLWDDRQFPAGPVFVKRAADAPERRFGVGFGRTATREAGDGTEPPQKLSSECQKPVTDRRSAHNGLWPFPVSRFTYLLASWIPRQKPKPGFGGARGNDGYGLRRRAAFVQMPRPQ